MREKPTVESIDVAGALAEAQRCIQIELTAIDELANRVGRDLPAALAVIATATGRVVISGIGKSGHIGRKIAATLASTGTPAFFIHATEALHGDAGMATTGDVAILISNSGETAEVCSFARQLSGRGIPVIAMTGRPGSTLGSIAQAVVDVGVSREADPLDLAPTASTTVTLVAGDALAASLMSLRGTTEEDFALHHPAGSLGQRLLAEAEGSID